MFEEHEKVGVYTYPECSSSKLIDGSGMCIGGLPPFYIMRNTYRRDMVNAVATAFKDKGYYVEPYPEQPNILIFSKVEL